MKEKGEIREGDLYALKLGMYTKNGTNFFGQLFKVFLITSCTAFMSVTKMQYSNSAKVE